jgi:thiol:disulfide interchange protein DsbA
MTISARRRNMLAALCAGPALIGAAPLWAQDDFHEGSGFETLPNPQPTDSPGKIEVLDFFWYGCPHCYDFLPSIEAWRKRKAADIAYKHVPVAFDPSRDPHSKIYYSLLALGLVDEMHVKVFDAFHKEHLRLIDTDEIADFMARNGIPRDRWLAVYNSFSVAGQVNRARLMTHAYTIDGTPTLAVDGRFLTSPSIVPSHTFPETIAALDYLTERVRKERAHR